MKFIKKYSNRGFTLIEIVIAMSIISLIVMAFFTIINISTKSNTKNERDIKSLNIATSEIESIREQLKNTIDDQLIINYKSTYGDADNKITITWLNDKVSSAIMSNGTNCLDKSNGKINYDIELDNIKYSINLEMTRNVVYNGMYMYDINIKVKLNDDYFSKKETVLTTQIFGK